MRCVDPGCLLIDQIPQSRCASTFNLSDLTHAGEEFATTEGLARDSPSSLIMIDPSHTAGVEAMTHGHHKISAALFVGSLIIGAAMILSAELTKPPRYEYRATNEPNSYLLFDTDTGRATVAQMNSKDPTAGFEK